MIISIRYKYYMDELQQTNSQELIKQQQPQLPVQTFVELPSPAEVPTPATHGVASIVCGNARIEISVESHFRCPLY